MHTTTAAAVMIEYAKKDRYTYKRTTWRENHNISFVAGTVTFLLYRFSLLLLLRYSANRFFHDLRLVYKLNAFVRGRSQSQINHTYSKPNTLTHVHKHIDTHSLRLTMTMTMKWEILSSKSCASYGACLHIDDGVYSLYFFLFFFEKKNAAYKWKHYKRSVLSL